MIYSLAVPGTIDDVEEVRVLEWHGQPGRVFAPGELVVELETHKALIEVRAGQAGVLRRIVSAEGDWQAAGRTLALFSDASDEDIPDKAGNLADMLVEFEIT